MPQHFTTEQIPTPLSRNTIILALLSGGLYPLGFVVPHAGLLSFAALVPFFFALHGKGAINGFKVGLITGTTINLIGTYWLIDTLTRFGGLNVFVSSFFHLATCVFWGLMFGIFGLLACRAGLLTRSGVINGITAAALFSALEFHFPFLFPYSMSNFLSDYPLLTQIYDLLGMYTLSFIVVLVNFTLFGMARQFITARGMPTGAMALSVALLVATLAYGALRVGQVERLMADAPKARVGIVQANFDIFDKSSENEAVMTLAHKALSWRLDSPDLVIWPETAVQSWVSTSAEYFVSGESVAVPEIKGAYFLVGGLSFTRKQAAPGDGEKVTYDQFNTAFLTDSSGRILGRYNKIKLLLFGEHLPFSDTFPWIKSLSPASGDFKPGTVLNTLVIPEKGISIAPLICYEDILPSFARRFVLKGANLLVNMTNDAWFGRSFEPYQHLKLAVARSVETRRYMLRSTNTGISAIIDPVGRVVERSGLFEEALIEAEVGLLETRTLYTRIGDVFPWGCTGVALIFVVIRLFRRKRGGESG